MFEISNKTKSKPPISGLLFKKIKERILGKKYSLSLVFCGDHLSKRLNTTYREKEKPTNILSFPLDKDGGEIFLNISLAKKQAKTRKVKYEDFVSYLFIHGLLHLKGLEHGEEMTKKEKTFTKEFKISEKVFG